MQWPISGATMFDLKLPDSMASLPGRVVSEPMEGYVFPHGNAHKVKRTHEFRLQQMREWHNDNRTRVNARKRAKYAAEKAITHEQRMAELAATTRAIEAQLLTWVNRGVT